MQPVAYESTPLGEFELGLLSELEDYTKFTRRFVRSGGISSWALAFQISIHILSWPPIIVILYISLVEGPPSWGMVIALFSLILLLLSTTLIGRLREKPTGQIYSIRGANSYSKYIGNMTIMFNRLCQYCAYINDDDIKRRMLNVELELTRVIQNLNMQRNLMLATVAGAGAATIMGARSFVRNLK